MVNIHAKRLAKKAGFVFWGNEAWGPGEGEIDWSCDYKEAFEKYTELIVQECADLENETLGADIVKRFGVKS